MADQKASPQVPWYEAYPEPRQKSPGKISREELLSEMNNGNQSGKDFLLVDVRRNDYEGGTIRGSLNLPAQSLYPTLLTLLQLVKNANIGRVIFYCGSSAGRGTRAAGWFADAISDQNVTGVQSLILTGGIKGWATSGREFTDQMDEYEERVWEQFK